MKFGFNFLTDQAKDELEKLGIRYTYEPPLWSVWTSDVDFVIDGFRSKNISIPSEVTKEERSQDTRVLKSKDSRRYYYLWKNVVFVMWQREHVDRRFNPPTVTEITVLDLVEKSEQDSMRDRLMKVIPNARILEGGVLI